MSSLEEETEEASLNNRDQSRSLHREAGKNSECEAKIDDRYEVSKKVLAKYQPTSQRLKGGECQPKWKTEQIMRGFKPKSKSHRD